MCHLMREDRAVLLHRCGYKTWDGFDYVFNKRFGQLPRLELLFELKTFFCLSVSLSAFIFFCLYFCRNSLPFFSFFLGPLISITWFSGM